MFVSEGTSLLSYSVPSLLRACFVDDEILLVPANLSRCCRDESLFQFVFSQEFACPGVPDAWVIGRVCRCIADACFAWVSCLIVRCCWPQVASSMMR